jgi:hypothetical protein
MEVSADSRGLLFIFYDVEWKSCSPAIIYHINLESHKNHAIKLS